MILDFIYYYLTLWFSTSKKKNRIRTPVERAAYTLGLVSMMWVMFICKAIEYFATNSFKKPFIPVLVYIVIGYGLMELYKYIYIKNGRYNSIVNNERPFSQYNISTRKGVTISIAICALSLVIPFSLRIILYIVNGE